MITVCSNEQGKKHFRNVAHFHVFHYVQCAYIQTEEMIMGCNAFAFTWFSCGNTLTSKACKQRMTYGLSGL